MDPHYADEPPRACTSGVDLLLFSANATRYRDGSDGGCSS
jgi:hypothetical protein